MDHAAIMAKITELLRDIFDEPELPVFRETAAKDVEGWDSMKQVMILLAVEETFEIELTTPELDDLQNVGDLVVVVANHIDALR
jgi:acyl carrier protein